MNGPEPHPGATRRSETLRETIEERIATGEYPPAMRLDESELAEEFGVSRTPIREALIQLDSEGLVEMRPRRGAVVVEITPQRLCEMFEVMAELEAMCARVAARRLTPADREQLVAVHEESQRVLDGGDPNAYFYVNERFHQAIYAASHNQFLIDQARSLQRRLRPYRRMQLHVRDRVRASFDEHNVITEAIVAGQGERAAQLLRDHVTVQGERFSDLLVSLSALQDRRPKPRS